MRYVVISKNYNPTELKTKQKNPLKISQCMKPKRETLQLNEKDFILKNVSISDSNVY